MKLKTIIALIFIVILVILSVQNYEATNVKFLFLKLSMSRVLIILGSFGIGVLVSMLIPMKIKSLSDLYIRNNS